VLFFDYEDENNNNNYYYYYRYYWLTPLFKVIMITQRKQTMFLGYVMLQLFCCYSTPTLYILFPVIKFALLREAGAQCPIWLLHLLPWCCAFQVRYIFSAWFTDGSNCSNRYWYLLCFVNSSCPMVMLLGLHCYYYHHHHHHHHCHQYYSVLVN